MTSEELPTNAKPILFNTEMVRKILAGEKTVTRRVIRFPEGLTGGHQVGEAGNPENPIGLMWACGIKRSRYQPGDILYVRETWARPSLNEINVGADPEKYLYKADSPLQPCAWSKWRPSIHMPKKAARILLRAIDVRAERLQDITEEQAKAEGAVKTYPILIRPQANLEHMESEYGTYLDGFVCIWNACYAKPKEVKKNGIITHYESYPWENIRETRTYKGKPWYVIGNPWVFATEFERVEAEIWV